MHSYNLNVFDLEVTFKAEASHERVSDACAYAENLYRGLKVHGIHLGRDRLLTILVLGITDDLLQLKQQIKAQEHRLAELLHCIENEDVPPA